MHPQDGKPPFAQPNVIDSIMAKQQRMTRQANQRLDPDIIVQLDGIIRQFNVDMFNLLFS